MEEADADSVARDNAAKKIVYVDWNTVEINARTDLVIAPISDIEMAKLFGIPVDERDKRSRRKGMKLHMLITDIPPMKK
jgi:hypothetical protein